MGVSLARLHLYGLSHDFVLVPPFGMDPVALVDPLPPHPHPVSCTRLVGYLPSSKKCQLKDFEEAINISEAYLPQPLALVFDPCQDVFLLVRALVVFVGDGISVGIGVVFAVKVVQVIDEKVVEQLLSCFSR